MRLSFAFVGGALALMGIFSTELKSAQSAEDIVYKEEPVKLVPPPLPGCSGFSNG